MALTGLPANLRPYGTTIIGVNACDEGCGERFVHFGKSTGWRQILCSWLDRVTLINNIGFYAGVNVANQYFFVPGIQYPDAPTVLYFDSIETEGIPGPPTGLTTGPNGMVGYLLARCRINFQTLPYLDLEQGTLSMNYAIQDLELPQNINSFYFNGNTSNPCDSSQIPAIQGTFTSYVWQTFNLASIPTATIAAACAAPIDQSGAFGTSTANGGTLRLMGVDTDRRVAQNGQEMWSMRTTLVENPFGWNCVFWPESQGGTDTFVEVKDQAGNPPIPLDTMGNIAALLGSTSY